MKQLIEQQPEELYEHLKKTYSTGFGGLDIAMEKTLKWHKQSLKQLIDGLIEREESTITGIGLLDNSNLSWTWDVAKKNTIKHLKDLRSQIK